MHQDGLVVVQVRATLLQTMMEIQQQKGGLEAWMIRSKEGWQQQEETKSEWGEVVHRGAPRGDMAPTEPRTQ